MKIHRAGGEGRAGERMQVNREAQEGSSGVGRFRKGRL